jgi:hypothetical protein
MLYFTSAKPWRSSLHLTVWETESCRLRLAGEFRRRTRENGRNPVLRTRTFPAKRRESRDFPVDLETASVCQHCLVGDAGITPIVSQCFSLSPYISDISALSRHSCFRLYLDIQSRINPIVELIVERRCHGWHAEHQEIGDVESRDKESGLAGASMRFRAERGAASHGAFSSPSIATED